MLSILIPTFHFNVFPLVSELHAQCEKAGIGYEIICLDDASQSFYAENSQINTIKNCTYEVLPKNIGRSSIRNLLGKKARYDWMLFLDADVFPKTGQFVTNYAQNLRGPEQVIAGGLLYESQKPARHLLLRWVYGTKREAITKENRDRKPYQAFLSSNFLITKNLLAQVPFNETIPDLRREDTLFSYNLMQQQIPILHIDNPVYHLGLDDFETAMRKENESLDGLKYLLDHNLLSPDYIKISKLYAGIKRWGLEHAFYQVHKLATPMYRRNLSGKNPSLFLFDLYRIGYLCQKDK